MQKCICIRRRLKRVCLMDFQMFGNADFSSEHAFAEAFSHTFTDLFEYKKSQETDDLENAIGILEQDTKMPEFALRLILEKFVTHFHELYGDSSEKFIEEEGRKYFLLYLRPIINGTGNYYIEARTREQKRTDIIVDYKGEQYIIEMKIWHGQEYNNRGEKQLVEYLEAYSVNSGYMLSFNFNKKKKIGVHDVVFEGKKIIEAVV